MNLSIFTHILGMGTIVLLITTFAVIIMRTIFGKHSTIITTLVKNALPIGFFLGFFALAGSLIYSEIYGLTPCLFCWWQRIFIYPLAILFGIAWYRSSKFSEEINIFHYTTPIAFVGTLVSTYHIMLQRGIVGPSGSCILNGTPCNIISTQVFGFITIPVMTFSIGLAITVLGILVLQKKNA